MATTPLTAEQERTRRRELVEMINPDKPHNVWLIDDGTSYSEMKIAYEKALREFELGPMGHQRAEYEDQKEKYYEYLKSPEWQEKRQECFEYYEHRCALCYGTEKLSAHHRTYERLFHEKPSDLIALCDPCHKRHHHHMIDLFGFNTNIPY